MPSPAPGVPGAFPEVSVCAQGWGSLLPAEPVSPVARDSVPVDGMFLPQKHVSLRGAYVCLGSFPGILVVLWDLMKSFCCKRLKKQALQVSSGLIT